MTGGGVRQEALMDLRVICACCSVTFSGLYVVDGHFGPVQDHVLPLPALSTLPIPADTQSGRMSGTQR